jgi:hypothetical protein
MTRAWHDEHPQDDPAFAPVHNVVSMIAQVDASSLEAHRRSIGIGRTHAKISRPPIGAIHLSLLPTFFRDPVVTSSILLSKFLSPGFGDGGRQREGLW